MGEGDVGGEKVQDRRDEGERQDLFDRIAVHVELREVSLLLGQFICLYTALLLLTACLAGCCLYTALLLLIACLAECRS